MKRKVTIADLAQIAAILAAIVLLVALTTGCASPAAQSFDLPALTVHCATQAEITREWSRRAGVNRSNVVGFRSGSSIFVRWTSFTDTDGEQLPDFETLGHEIWHVLKPGWHK